MARLYQPMITRYVDKNGKRCSKSTPEAVAVRSKSKTWRGIFRGLDGVEYDVALCKNKQASQLKLNELIKEDQSGDSFTKFHRQPLTKHLVEFEKSIIAKGGTEQHARQTAHRCQSVLEGCHFKLIKDLNASRVSSWLKDQRDSGRFSRSTSNGYLIALKNFCNWLVRDGRTSSNPLGHLSRLNTAVESRLERRAATILELDRLISAAEKSEVVFRGLTGLDRAMLYRVAIGTGFRAGELASLVLKSFQLETSTPTITVSAAYSKRRREDVQPISPVLAESIRAWLALLSKNESEPEDDLKVWPGTWHTRAAEMMRVDLQAAEVEFETRNGKLDFHSLRHTYISSLSRAGIHHKTAQELARHSDISLTMNTYTHLDQTVLSAAVATLPVPNHSESDNSKMVAGMVAVFPGNHSKLVQPDETDSRCSDSPLGDEFTALNMRETATEMQQKLNGATGTRTQNQRIMSPLL